MPNALKPVLPSGLYPFPSITITVPPRKGPIRSVCVTVYAPDRFTPLAGPRQTPCIQAKRFIAACCSAIAGPSASCADAAGASVTRASAANAVLNIRTLSLVEPVRQPSPHGLPVRLVSPHPPHARQAL